MTGIYADYSIAFRTMYENYIIENLTITKQYDELGQANQNTPSSTLPAASKVRNEHQSKNPMI